MKDGTLLTHMMKDKEHPERREYPVNSVHSVAPDPESLPSHIVVSALSTCGLEKKTCKDEEKSTYDIETNTVEAVETR